RFPDHLYLHPFPTRRSSDLKGSTTIKGALNELDMAGLLERERGGFSAPNRLYVKVPRVPQVQFSDQLMAGKPTLIEPENRPTDGDRKSTRLNSSHVSISYAV